MLVIVSLTWVLSKYNVLVLEYKDFVYCKNLIIHGHGFYVQQQNASRVLAIVEVSVCPSICPFVTLWYCVKTVLAKITKFSL